MAETKKGLPQPENHGAWESATKGLLGSAKSVTDELFAALQDKEVRPPHERKVQPAYVNPGPSKKADLDDKLSVVKHSVNVVDSAVQLVGQCLLRLGHEQQNKWAPLKVNEWRLAIRERRPPRELFRDHVHEALDKEQASLKDARVKLAELAVDGKAILEDCDINKARLIRNLRFMTMLGSTKLPVFTAAQSGGELPTSPSSPSSPAPDGADAASPRSRPVVPNDTEGLVNRAPQLKENAIKFVSKCDAAIKRHQKRCEETRDQVMVCFKKRLAENTELKKTLHEQILEMDAAIASAEKSLVAIKKRIEFYGEVEMQPKYDSCQALLIKLRESKVVLEDDFHHKMVSMKIDEACRKVTPEKTGTSPDSLPLLAMLEGPKKKLNRTNSSPAFVGESSASIRPTSPAIKAAGALSVS